MKKAEQNWTLNRKNGVAYLTFPFLERFPFAVHAFSTRIGGVSGGEFASMNLSFGRGDPAENVRENYRRFCAAAGFDDASLVLSAQDHHTFVRRVGRAERGLGIWRPRDRASVDGLITDEPGVTLVTAYADCVPLYFVDARTHACGLSHAGWRGTAAGMAAAAVRAMEREFGSRPEDLFALIGPSIGPCCFEVDAPVRDAFAALPVPGAASLITDDKNGKYHVNLWEANRKILLAANVPAENICVSGLCTQCHADLLFSHRATGGKRGGMAAFLARKEED